MRIKLVTTTEYHTQSRRKVEGYNRTFATGLRHNEDKHYQDWDVFEQAVTYVYNT